MPRGDRTGPPGMGPRSGRGAGYCAGSGQPGAVSAFDRGLFERGRGLCNWFSGLGLRASMRSGRAGNGSRRGLDGLTEEADALRSRLDALMRRFDSLNEKE
jgi:hypothetical protein